MGIVNFVYAAKLGEQFSYSFRLVNKETFEKKGHESKKK